MPDQLYLPSVLMIPVIDHFLGYFSQDLGVDLGTVNTLIHVRGKGIVIREPSVVAQQKKTKKVLAIGGEAKKMLGRVPASIVVVRPLRDGVISDFDTTLAMLSHFVKKIHARPGKNFSIPRPRIVIGVPTEASEVERRALLDVAYAAGARSAYLIEEPIAAAIGAGLSVGEPVGSMIVDIGGGTCEIAVISLGGIVAGRFLKTAGDAMDADIVSYVRSRFGLAIGEATAEEIKIALGNAYPLKVEKETIIRGRDLEKGLPKSVRLTSVQVREALSTSLSTIVSAIKDTVEDSPPELSADIMNKGIIMSGGGSLLPKINELVAQSTGVPCFVAEEPLFCVIKGTGLVLEHLPEYKKVVMSKK